MTSRLPFFLSFLLLALSAQADDKLPGIAFSHNDWELYCDNTGTCRAAGYQADDTANAVSVLLTRAAGPDTPVEVQLMLGEMDDDNPPPAKGLLTMRIDGRAIGTVAADALTLNPAQQAALLSALTGSGKIEWVHQGKRWQLSDKGATAVLLKMDNYQGRVGTPSALVRKGKAAQNKVRKPTTPPQLDAVPLVKPRPHDAATYADGSPRALALRKALLKTIAGEASDCNLPTESEDALRVSRLSATHLLAALPCWRGAYNSGDAYWVIDETPSFNPVLVTTSGSSDDGGSIASFHKGRGIGDCVWSEEWLWNGKAFVHASATSGGMCKGVALGGAWDLPRLVTQVRAAPRGK